MRTRGVRQLQEYLGADAEQLTRARRAQDLVPTLTPRTKSSDSSAAKRASPIGAATGGGGAPADALLPRVVDYLRERHAQGATNKLSSGQLRLVTKAAAVRAGTEGGRLLIKRLRVDNTNAMVDVLAVMGLQRAEVYATSTTSGGSEGASLFVFAEDASLAAELRSQLTQRYGLEVLHLVGEGAVRHPTFPLLAPTQRCRSATPLKKTSASSSSSRAAEAHEETDEHCAEVALCATVVISIVDDFLRVDKRSAIWKHIGAYVVALRHPARSSALVRRLASIPASAESVESDTKRQRTEKGRRGSATEASLGEVPLAHRAAEHRFACLGHAGVACVLSQHADALTAPPVDWLLTLRQKEGPARSPAPAAVDVSGGAVPPAREGVTVRYATAEGVGRFQFLYGLVNGLAANRGLVVHVATREACGFLYDALYSFADDLPQHVEIYTDYEGESQFSALKSAKGRQALCDTFNATVQASSGKTAAALLSCHGLVPAHGCIFLQYDIVPDLPNFPHFISEVLTPGAARADAALTVQRDVTVRTRRRSTSPVPPEAAKSSARGAATGPTPYYRFIFLLFRPNEVPGALRHLRATAPRHSLTITAMGQKPSEARYMRIGARLLSMNKRLFAIQNAAYHAYRATMIVYCTVGPRNVYDEKRVNLQKVAEEFGYVEVPLLDLRLKDTPFRPKEDYFKAAKQKQSRERRAYRQFVSENIVGEAPEEHIVDESTPLEI